MDSEYELVCQKLLGGRDSGTLGGNSITVRKCGIGKVNAAVSSLEMIRDLHPDLVVNTGIAGAVKHRAGRGDVVVADKVAYHDVWCGEGIPWGQVQGLPMYFACSPAACAKARDAASGTGATVHSGLLCSGDRFVVGSTMDKECLGHFPDAIAVDMESGAVAQVCHLKEVPFVAIRIISDVAEDEDQLVDYAKFFSDAAKESFSILERILKDL